MSKYTHFSRFLGYFLISLLVGCAASPVSTLNTPVNIDRPAHIALLLPLHGPAGQSGQMVRDGFLNAYYQAHREQTISFYDTSKNSNMAALYQQAVAAGATFVVGPLLKENVESLNRSASFSVPTLELNYSDTSLPRNVYQFGLNPTDEAEQMAQQAKNAGLSRALLIAPQTPWGQRVSHALKKEWQAQGGTIVDAFYFMPHANFNQSIANLLGINAKVDTAKSREKNTKTSLAAQRRQDFDVIFLFAEPVSAREIVPLLKYYYADNVPTYATSSIYSGTPNSQKDQDLNGVIFSDIPWIIHNKQSNRLFAVGRDAYLLSEELGRLTQSSNQTLSADTGTLTLRQQKIYRQVSWTRMQNGQP